MKMFSFIILALIIGFVGGYFINKLSSQSLPIQREDCESKYEFINSRIGCQQNIIDKREYTEFTSDLETYIAQEKDKGHVFHVSVYFRDLIAGPTFGINSGEKFVPASLLKLPMIMTYLSLSEQTPDILTQKIVYNNIRLNAEQSTSNIPQLEKNKEYSIDDLISRTIIYSDNKSEALLRNYLSTTYPKDNLLIQTMTDLGLVDPRDPIENTLTVKAYGTLFRQLYNSSYLSPAMSEKALKLLAKSKFKNGISGGLPKDIKAAHKFGEREEVNQNEKQLHDCGIVYYPNNPYLLCVMTRGDDMQELESVIKTISEKVYKEVDSRRIQ